MRKSSFTLAAGLLVALSSLSEAQYSTLSAEYTIGWGTVAGCDVANTFLTLPGGINYYVPNTGVPGGSSLGLCSFGSNGFQQYNTLNGWLGMNSYVPPNPPSQNSNEYTNDDDDQHDDGPPEGIQLVSNTEGENNPPPPPGGHNDIIQTSLETQVTATPEPASLILVASGLVGIATVARRRRKS